MTTTTIMRRYHFESAHWLPLVPEGHKCKRLHGHNYKIEVTLSGEPDDKGWLLDFWDLDAIVQPLIDRVDHRCLNDIEGLSNPTAELIAAWFLERINADLPTKLWCSAVCVHETADATATAMLPMG